MIIEEPQGFLAPPKFAVKCHLCRATAPAASWHALAYGFARREGWRIYAIEDRIHWNLSHEGRRLIMRKGWLCPVCQRIFKGKIREEGSSIAVVQEKFGEIGGGG